MSVAAVSWACRTPLGDSPSALLAALLEGVDAVGPIARFPGETYACSVAAGVHTEPPAVHERILSPMARHAYGAAVEAWEMAGAPRGDRVGLFAGIGGPRADWPVLMPALAKQNEALTDTWQNGFRRLHPFWMLQHLSNNAHALLSIAVEARGEGSMFGGANAGCQALAAAERALLARSIDVALVVAHDSLIEPEKLVPMGARGELVADAIARAAPYDAEAVGGVPGEAAAALVLVRPDDADGRALFYLSAQAGADDQRGRPKAALLASLVAQLLAREGLDGGNIAVDGAAATSVEEDADERRALAEALGDVAAPLTSMVSAMGQVGAADGLVRAIGLGAALRAGRLYPISGLRSPTPGPLRPVVAPEATAHQAAVAVCAASPGLAGAVYVSAAPGLWSRGDRDSAGP